MIPPFNRRDSACCASGGAVLLAAATADTVAQAGFGTAGAGFAGVVAASCFLFLFGVLARRLPADVPLRPCGPVERRDAKQPPPDDAARLRVALRREAMAFHRLDVFLDDVRVGQLRPGTALVLLMQPGRHVLSARVWFRRLDLRDEINALPETDSDFVIRGAGGKARTYEVDRHGLPALLGDRRTVLVEPLRRLA